MNFTESKTEWVKFGDVKNICFVGRETICVTGGCELFLFNLTTKEETHYRANCKETGEGIRFVAGHKTLNVFAFAEKCINPTLFVRTCPEIKEICTVHDGSEDEYLAMVFSEAEFLITLSDLPSFTITIWNWRNGEKIATEKSNTFSRHQLLRCSYGSPVALGQMIVGTNLLYVWDILMCGKRCIVNRHEVISPKVAGTFTALLWTSEGSLFVLDRNGHVFLMNAEYVLELAIKWEEPGDKETYFVWYKAGLTIAGPSSEIKHYKKSGGWICDWTVKTEVAVVRLLNSPRDYLIGVTEECDISLFDAQQSKFNALKQYESKFDSFCLIYPTGEYLITLAHQREITAWNVSTGKMVDTKKLEGTALAIAENPEYPYFGVTFEHGTVQLFSFYKDNTIQLLTTFQLTRNPLNSIRFCETGLFLVANMSCGEFFVIEGLPGTKMIIVANVRANCQIADYILVASKTCFRLFILKVTSDKYIAGNLIYRFCVIRGRPCPAEREYVINDGKTLYSRLYTTTKENRDRVFYGTSLMSKLVHELETKRGDLLAKLVNKIKSGHQMRKFYYHFDKHHTVSFGYDGLVVIRTPEFVEKAIIMPHHRMDHGILKAYIDPMGKHVISLGRNNVLVCTSLTHVKFHHEKYEEIYAILKDPKLELMFGNPTTGFLPKGEYEGKTWIEVGAMKQEEYEFKICEKNRKAIRIKYKEIRNEVRELLTKNLEGPENEYLDIQDFNLDSQLKEEKTFECKEKCKETKLYLEALIIAQDKVSKFIKEYCWDKMALQGRSLYGLFANFSVDSYVMLPADVDQDAVLKYIEAHRKIEDMMANDEIFEPWVPKTPSQMRLQLEKNPKIQEIVAVRKREEDDEDDSEEDLEEEKLDEETITAFTGAVTHEFVTLYPGHYLQHQIQTFLQTEYQTILSRVENIKLRERLNKDFDFLMSLKVREVNNLKERNSRLRHIISEINYFSTQKMDITVIDPEWRQEENPEKILEVQNHELSVTPYISPSEQAILDAAAAEAERIRLLLLADDFKERALMAMMNGVLEVRWEDELRKDVPVPKCVTEKVPEDYREDDLRAIKDYDEKVKFLESERERYKRILTAEYANVANSLRESVRKFNTRVDDLLLNKIKIDSAITQENLKINRLRLRNYKRISMNEHEKEAQKAIVTNDKHIDEIQKLITSLYDNLNEYRNSLDALQSKEKLLDKAYRRDLLEASPAGQEIAQKQYKRRPKTNIRGITSTTVLLDLARCAVTREQSVILNQEALDFLKAIDTMDLYVGIPNAVDEHLYATICRHRRLKIESEIKIKAATMDITEGESTIAYFHNKLAHKKELAHTLTANLASIRTEKIKQAENIELQLVLKEGFVEVYRGGEIKDFDDAIMVSRKDIEDINTIIIKGGNRKLKAMRDTMNFRRGILTMEWEHKKLKMKIEDLEDYIKDIHSIKVTKEIQSYLKSRARGDSPDKGLTFEQEVELVKLSYQRIIDERKALVKELQQKINTMNKSNKKLDKDISDINVDVCEYKLDVDDEIVQKEKDILQIRMSTLLKRAKLVKQIQENHNEILVLQTELELLRLKTYPTLKYKIFS